MKDEAEFFLASQSSRADLLRMWGSQPVSEAEVRAVFSSYYAGGETTDPAVTTVTTVTRLPWRDAQPSQEIQEDRRRLEQFSQEGFLSINFLPAASCVDSRDQSQGWGTQPGYVFQVRLDQSPPCPPVSS